MLATWPTDKLVVWGVVTVIGLTKGTRAVFQSVVLPKYVSLDKVAAANGINMLFTGFVSLAMGPVIGGSKDFFLFLENYVDVIWCKFQAGSRT